MAFEIIKGKSTAVIIKNMNFFIINYDTQIQNTFHLQAQLLCDGKLIHSASLDSAGFFDFSPVSVDSKVYFL